MLDRGVVVPAGWLDRDAGGYPGFASYGRPGLRPLLVERSNPPDRFVFDRKGALGPVFPNRSAGVSYRGVEPEGPDGDERNGLSPCEDDALGETYGLFAVLGEIVDPARVPELYPAGNS